MPEKGLRHIWIPALIAALPLLAVVFLTPVRKQWIWNLNVLPLPFVLSNFNYLNTCHVTLTFEDGSKAWLDRKGISKNILATRFDFTVFSHLVRYTRLDSADEASSYLQRLFCNYSEHNKKVTSFDFEILSAKLDPILREHESCR